MALKWYFKPFAPGDRARNSQVEKFFRSDAVEDACNALVREGIQNSLDAARQEGTSDSIKVRISIGEIDPEQILQFLPGLFEHLDCVRDKMPGAPSLQEPMRYLAFEDFNTTGLQGDPEQWEPLEGTRNAFFNFFRGEGVSEKSQHERGRHGVGKMVFSVASRAHCIYGLSCTKNGPPLLMGTATLMQHRCNEKPFHPDGWFGEARKVDGSQLVVPTRDTATISRFASAFGLERENFQGLSIVVPWIVPAVTHDAIVKAVVKGYFWPILQKNLFVEVASKGKQTDIEARTLLSVVESMDSEADRLTFKDEMKATIGLAQYALGALAGQLPSASPPSGNAQEWQSSLLSQELRLELQQATTNGKPIALCLPMNVRRKGKQAESTHFHMFLMPDTDCSEGRIHFIRDGLLISGVKSRRSPGFRALVIVEHGPLGTFLGDSENPSHTEWQKENVREKYLFHDSCIRYVVNCVPNLLKTLNEGNRQSDPSLLIDLFSIPGELNRSTKSITGKGGKKPGKTPPVMPPIPRKPQRLSLQKVASGFVLRRGEPGAALPRRVQLELAYGVRRGSPFRKYDTADFDVAKLPIVVTMSGGAVVECKGNRVVIDIDDGDFELKALGFDIHRDLFVNPRIDTTSDSAEAAEQEDG